MSEFERVGQKVGRPVDWKAFSPKDQATLLFVVQRELILLIRKKRGLGAGKINGPGGRLDPLESPRDCAIRETQEELAITPIQPQEVGSLSFVFVDGYSVQVSVFMANRFTGAPTETEEAAPIWTPISKIPYDQMWEDDRLWLPMALKGERFEGRMVFDDDRLLDYALRPQEAGTKGASSEMLPEIRSQASNP